MPAAAELVAGRTAGRSGVAWNAEQKTHASSNRKVLIAACFVRREDAVETSGRKRPASSETG
jgi:hypothetical protein